MGIYSKQGGSKHTRAAISLRRNVPQSEPGKELVVRSSLDVHIQPTSIYRKDIYVVLVLKKPLDFEQHSTLNTGAAIQGSSSQICTQRWACSSSSKGRQLP